MHGAFFTTRVNFTFLIILKVSSQVALNFFYASKINVQSIWGLLKHQGFATHVESRS
eukprot:UN25024